MRKLPARKLLCAAIAGALFLPLKGFTLGLGEIEVNSALNQKFKAEIELLSATPEDAENIIVKLASRKEFSRAGLDRPYLLSDLRFKSELVDGVPHILVSTGSPVREPFLNFLLEIDWPNGHLLREYTVLLDPPVFMTQAASTASVSSAQNTATGGSAFRPSASTSNVVPVAAPSMPASSRPEASASMPSVRNDSQVSTPAVMQPAVVPAPVIYQQQTTINQPSGSYKIKQGDTAWSLANAMRPDQSVSVEQMMIAMLRSNPESFINENVNGLKRGYILRIPDYNQIVSIQQEEAQALVREQAALWRQYQQSQTGGQPASAMPSGDLSESKSSAEDGAVTTGEGDDAYLEIVSAGSGTSSISGKDPTEMSAQELRAELALARERVETERVEKEALQSRIDLLEQNVGKMKGMLSIEDDELSDIQSLNLPAEGELAETLAEPDELQEEQDFRDSLLDKTSDGAIDETVVETGLDADEELAGDLSAEDMAADELAAEDMIAETTGTEESSAEDALFVDETSADADEGQQDEMSAAESQIEPQIATQTEPQIASRPPADPLSKLLSDPVMLAAAGGGLLLIAGLIGLIIKRRKTAAETAIGEEMPAMAMDVDALDSVADEVADEISDTEAGVSETVADSDDVPAVDEFDSDSTMVLDSAEGTLIAESDLTAGAEVGAVEAEDESRDDVLAEADVYLAYGIYQQAEELLEQAITDNPDRIDYRVKLAETLYASKNAEAFVKVATEIHKREGAENTPAWKKVMGMGQDLCSDNPLFQGSIIGGLDVAALAPNTPEMDFDLGLDDDSSSDLDLNLDDQPLELADVDDEEPAEPADVLEFDLSDTGAIEEKAVSDDEFSLDIDASELDIDIVDEASETATDEAASKEDEILDIGDIDFDLDDDSTGGAVAEAAPADDEDIAIDLTDELDSLDMDLADDLDVADLAATDDTGSDDTGADEEDVGEASVTDEPAPEPVPEPEEEPVIDDSSDEDDFDLSSLDDVDEISTKLDLARAYLDMGDHEGTRSILEEVIAEGSDEQKQEANELMEKLG